MTFTNRNDTISFFLAMMKNVPIKSGLVKLVTNVYNDPL